MLTRMQLSRDKKLMQQHRRRSRRGLLDVATATGKLGGPSEHAYNAEESKDTDALAGKLPCEGMVWAVFLVFGLIEYLLTNYSCRVPCLGAKLTHRVFLSWEFL